MSKLSDQATDFPQWYLDVIEQADLAEHADVKGCIIFKPYGYAIWEAMQRDMDRRIKELGVQNAYFPLFIPESLIAKEADHVEGFAPECAVVTHGGGKELTEKLYVRPTSETIIYSTFSRWIQSHRDLPLKINQWCNVVRWEMRTRPFLRTLEFLWQEGHTAHATKEDADAMAEAALKMYSDFDRETLAIPVVTGFKPEHDKFAGALYTLSTEALAKDGKAIQAGTSHNLGQGFSEAYDVSYQDDEGNAQRPWMTSWGVSTRLIGTLIVMHGDEKGLKLPPKVAPTQVVVVPIYKTDEEQGAVLKTAQDIADALPETRVYIDDRDEKSPGFKFNEWEVKGVPVRMEIGPKDLEKKQVMLARRDNGDKSPVPIADINQENMTKLLDLIQADMLAVAERNLVENTHSTESYDEMKKIIEDKGGLVWMPWDGDEKTAKQVQTDLKATIRLIDKEKDVAGKKDPVSGADAKMMALYAKAY